MTDQPERTMNQIDQFTTELDQLIGRYRGRFGITYASLIGSLQLVVHDLSVEASQLTDDAQ